MDKSAKLAGSSAAFLLGLAAFGGTAFAAPGSQAGSEGLAHAAGSSALFDPGSVGQGGPSSAASNGGSGSGGAGNSGTSGAVLTTSAPITNPGGGTLPANNGAGSTTFSQIAPQPYSTADGSGNGANATPADNIFASTGYGQVQGGHAAGSVGKADNKYPPGQSLNDANKGYECDANPGIGNGNPAHTTCQASLSTGGGSTGGGSTGGGSTGGNQPPPNQPPSNSGGGSQPPTCPAGTTMTVTASGPTCVNTGGTQGSTGSQGSISQPGATCVNSSSGPAGASMPAGCSTTIGGVLGTTLSAPTGLPSAPGAGTPTATAPTATAAQAGSPGTVVRGTVLTPAPSNPAPVGSAVSPTATAAQGGTLPFTGADSGALSLMGGLAVAAGAVMRAAARRRRSGRRVTS